MVEGDLVKVGESTFRLNNRVAFIDTQISISGIATMQPTSSLTP